MQWWTFEIRAKRSPFDSLDDPHLPERPAAVEGLREQPPGEFLQRSPRARSGQRDVAQVVGQVEADIVHPEARAGERVRGEALAVAGQVLEATLDVLREPRRIHPAVGTA